MSTTPTPAVNEELLAAYQAQIRKAIDDYIKGLG